MSTCGDNESLDKLKELQGGLDSKLAGGQAQLDALKADMNSMKDQAKSFLPEIPEVTSFQAELAKLAAIAEDPIAFLKAKLDLESKFKDSVPDLNSVLGKLGVDEFPPKTPSIKDICAAAPNVEIDSSGVAKEQPEPPKVADVVPPPPVPKEVYVPDVEAINKELLNFAYRMTKGRIWNVDIYLFFTFRKKKTEQEYFDLTWPEMNIYLFETAGEDVDKLKRFNYTVADLRSRQVALKQKRPKNDRTDAYDFQSYGPLFEENYNKYKAEYSSYSNAGSFAQACTESVARYKKKYVT
tara:strand:- start:706 stop:1593 length:888 start_codon:yes stop_codon:yes gene_type:complete